MVKDGKKVGTVVKEGENWRPAVVPALALIAVGFLPALLTRLYEPYVGSLVTAYVASGMLFIVMVLGGLSFMMYRDRAALSRTTKVFTFRPDEVASDSDEVAPIKVETNRPDNE